MLDAINRGAPAGLPAKPRSATTLISGAAVTTPQASVVAAYYEESVKISVSAHAITAAITTTSVVATATLGPDAVSGAPFSSDSTDSSALSGGAVAAQADAQRAQQALGAMVQAKGAVAGTMKTFLREKLEGYKKQLQLLRLLGADPLEIAKGAVKIARGVAGAARDYAAATLDERAAGTASGAAADTESESKAQADAAALKAAADAAPLDSAGDNPANAPSDPDERFFYDAYRILGLARKTIIQAQQVDTAQHGGEHAKDFKKLRQREGELEEAVTKSYIAMKTGGDLKAVDALLNDGGGGGPAVSTLV